jgi:hypothetical protein
MTQLGFMSQEHVDRMNEILRGVPEVQEAAAGLGTERVLAYELSDGPDGDTVWWTVTVGPASGFRFGLDPPAAAPDVVLRADWKQMIRATAASKSGGEAQLDQHVDGDPAVLQQIMTVVEIGRPHATLETEIPAV